MKTEITDTEKSLLPPADLIGEIERLKEELQVQRDQNLYALADFQNYRRRVERDNGKVASESKREMIMSMLEILDDMEKALSSSKISEHSVIHGVRRIHKKFLLMLESYGVIPFESAGTPFNHNLHEAVAMVKNDEAVAGNVVDELRRGYLWNDDLLRAAQVSVAE